MDPIGKSHPEETTNPPKNGSGAAAGSGSGPDSPLKRKIQEVSGYAISSNPSNTEPTLAKRVGKSLTNRSDANFDKSLMFKKQDLEHIEVDKAAFDKIKGCKNLSSENIEELLTIFYNQKNKRYIQYQSSQSLIDEISTYINGSTFKDSILAKLDDNKNGLDQNTLERIVLLPLKDIEFKDNIENKLQEISEAEAQLNINFIKSFTFDDLFAVLTTDNDHHILLNGKPLTRDNTLTICNDFEFHFLKHLEVLLMNETPVKGISLLQHITLYSKKMELDLGKHIINLEIETAKRLFTTKQDAENGISQKNFKDQELGIIRGGADYCCGSIAVEALVSKFKGKTIEEVIKNGVIRHLKLPKEHMRTLTAFTSLIEYNEDIRSIGEVIIELGNQKQISYTRYLNFLNKIPAGSSGIILSNIAFIMYSENIDTRSIEIFDSHGSSIPLITGTVQPAYRAFFSSKENTAAYLCVHRQLQWNHNLHFYPGISQ